MIFYVQPEWEKSIYQIDQVTYSFKQVETKN